MKIETEVKGFKIITEENPWPNHFETCVLGEEVNCILSIGIEMAKKSHQLMEEYVKEEM